MIPSGSVYGLTVERKSDRRQRGYSLDTAVNKYLALEDIQESLRVWERPRESSQMVWDQYQWQMICIRARQNECEGSSNARLRDARYECQNGETGKRDHARVQAEADTSQRQNGTSCR